MRISTTLERAEKIRRLLEHEWRSDRVEAEAQEVLSIAGKLGNLTFEVRAGIFARQPLRLTDLHGKYKRRKHGHRSWWVGIENLTGKLRSESDR